MTRLMRTRRSVLPALAALLLALTPAMAQADAGATIVRQCLNQGKVSGNYSQQAYNQALAELPADVREYSDCPNLIRAAQLAGAAHGGSGGPGAPGAAAGPGGSGPGGSIAALSAPEKAALAAAARPRSGSPAIQVGGQLVNPGLVHVNVASALNRLPTPLLALLAVLVAGGLFVAGRFAYQRVGSRRAP